MSQIRMKWVLASGLFLAMTFASVSWAQISQMRLFSPYPDDQFGGGAYMREGLYGSVGAGMLNIALPSTQTIGYTNYDTQPMYNMNQLGSGFYLLGETPNQIDTSAMHSEFSSATEFEIGRQEGHHGWSFKAQIVTPPYITAPGFDGGLSIYDPQTVSVGNFIDAIRLADPTVTMSDMDWNDMVIYDTKSGNYVPYTAAGAPTTIGRLWAMVSLTGSGTTNNVNTGSGSGDTETTTNTDNGYSYALTPIPFIFNMESIEYKVNFWSVEAMYTYRFHPFRRGVLEMLAGVRYTVFDDRTAIFGHATTKLENSYDITRIEILQSGSTAAAGGQAIGSESQDYKKNTQTEDTFSGANLGYSSWNFLAENHIVGPQVGGRYTLSNNRWRFMTEGKFFAGFNRQNINGYGQFGFKAESSQSGNLEDSGGLPLKAPLATNANRFNYSNHFNEFTPGAELRFEAAWYWTEAVSFKFGYQFQYLGEIARSLATNEYAINNDGSFFRVKSNKDERNFDTLVHGVMFTAQINK